MSLLELRAATRRFGGFVALDAADLAVDAGEVVGLLGANGAGKTTAIRLGLGLLRPSAGRVANFGRAPSRATRRRVGYVPQGLGLWPDLTVGENLAFAASAYGRHDVASDPALARLDDELVRDLPLGARRRVAFAAALQHDPELLVLDEPTSGVDALARSRLWDRIRARAEAGVGVLVSTHFMDEARQCDRLVLLARGRVAATGSERDLVAGQSVVEVDGHDWDAVFEALDARGFAVGLVGARVRVAGADPAEVGRALDDAGVGAAVRAVPATLEEAMLDIARGPGAESLRRVDPAG